MSGITTHVLDTALGRPAAHVPISLQFFASGAWKEVGNGATDADGRLRTLLPAGEPLAVGKYRIVFDTAAYFLSQKIDAFFYPSVAVEFVVADAIGHFHVPLLISPYGYSTYRGS